MPHVTITRAMSWNVFSRVTAITREMLWHVRVRVTPPRQMLWHVRKRLTLTRGMLWVVNDNLSTGQGQTETSTCTPWPASSTAFYRIYIDHLVRGSTKVYWELHRNFRDASPYTFQLQYNDNGLSDADNWVNVDGPVVDSFYSVDATQRLYGKQLNSYYRVRLTTGVGTYYSIPTPANGKLNKRDWNMAREITRKELLRLQRYTALNGYLLIAKRAGTVCTCRDPLTNETTNTYCTDCYGTGWVGGYYSPYSCVFFDVSQENSKEAVDVQARGMTDDNIKQTRYVGYPHIKTRDVFVDRDSDSRYYVNSIRNLAEIRGVPIVVSPELRAAPYTDVVYNFNITGSGQ